MGKRIDRRTFIQGSGFALGACLLSPRSTHAAEVPINNPTEKLNLPWTGELRWEQAIDIRSIAGDGKYWDKRLAEAQRILGEKGGGTVFFPAGEYAFEEFIKLRDGVVLRGATPAKRDAHETGFAPTAKIVFPKYIPLFKGDGTPIDTAFKGIVLDEPGKASNCGVAFLSIDRGHIHLSEEDGHRCGRNRLVYGCVLTNAAVADPNIKRSKKVDQPGWHRVISRHHAAIDVKSALQLRHPRLPAHQQQGQQLPLALQMRDNRRPARRGQRPLCSGQDFRHLRRRQSQQRQAALSQCEHHRQHHPQPRNPYRRRSGAEQSRQGQRAHRRRWKIDERSKGEDRWEQRIHLVDSSSPEAAA